MRPTHLTFILFLIVALVQLAAPGNEIISREWTLRSGTPVKFRTAPVDPYDAFRGRYVALSFSETTAPVASASAYSDGQRVYALLETDADGFARVTGISESRPVSGLALGVRVRDIVGPAPNYRAVLDLPFDRFYMEETLAPAAEQAYRRATSASRQQAYILVRVRDGQGVIEDLYIQDKPIRQFLAENG